MSAPASAATIWDGQRLGITVGSVVLIFLAAIEALAVTTVMPLVATDLQGEALYAVAFAGTLATGVIGMVVAGAWSDRAGPRAPLYTAIALFIVGLVIAGAATDMYTLVLGRLIQGLGGGGQTVALYVVVARVYPPQLHGRIFAAYAAAWVVPSMVGPFLAGAVAQYLHWRWAFLGVAVLTAVAFVLVAVRLRGVDLNTHPGEAEDPPAEGLPAGARIGLRIMLAVIVAVAAVVVGFAADLAPAAGWPLAAASVMAIAFAIRPLLPAGTLRAAPRLPSVVLMRGLAAGAFFAAEAYVPKMLMERFDFSPTIAGLALTVSALAWSGGSAVQGRYGDRLGSRRMEVISTVLMLVGFGGVLVVAAVHAAPWVVVVLWGFAGGGMGLLYPRLTVLTLAYSTPTDEGFNSSALSISDSTGSAVTIAIAGLLFVSLPIAGSGFPVVFGLAVVVLLIAAVPGFRLGDGPAAPAVSSGDPARR
ncbi:MFS transporter [Microbacterium bovistercoris]|uniref:MFS transporter n=1 Tax=Microbacterium bovistercoris TaxID=2293570 RepID=A0A371NQH2_9MICO|nr:MFS transporter [Microbacterium bovistercoris]REJ04444.1 MFS transporter [Microbacterium bovistercoris]